MPILRITFYAVRNAQSVERNMHHRIVILTLLLLTASCVPPPADRPWAYADMRGLDTADALQPSLDLIAIYTRQNGSDFQIRLDLLDLETAFDFDLYIVLDTSPGGLREVFLNAVPSAATSITNLTATALEWDLLLILPAHDSPRAYLSTESSPSAHLIPRLVRDPWLDTVTVSLSRHHLPTGGHIALQVFTTAPGQHLAADSIGPVRSDASPPTNRAPLLLAFWDTFPAHSPAQALRRWDGAHTGPTGERHGLRYVLDSAERYGLPVALLDLKTPASLAALRYLGGMAQIQRLLDRRLLILPDVAYGEPAQASVASSRRAAQTFGLPASQFVYTAFPFLQPAYRAQFANLPIYQSASHLTHWKNTILIPLPAPDAPQATTDGPSPDVRRALLETALSPDPADLVVLGGSLPHSTWGDADMAASTFAWLAAHPWIQPLDGNALLTFPAPQSFHAPRSPENASSPASTWLTDLRAAPDNVITDLAWQTYFTLTAPTDDAQLRALRANYFGQIGILLAASRWAENPFRLSECSIDFDADGENECLLASTTFFAIIETDGARLTHLFYRDENSPHQLIGPTAQFWIGISDPSLWDLSTGRTADPGQIMGAFSDTEETLQNYDFTFPPNGSLSLTSADGTRVKIYYLTDNGVIVEYHTATPVTTRIPLVVDPQAFFFGEVGYHAVLGPNFWRWGPEGGPMVNIQSTSPMRAQGFTASYPFLSLPEDPNLDYPLGHYFPFPLSLIEITVSKIAVIEITVNK